MNTKRLFSLLEERREKMIEDRRWLHMHPELSFEETETSKFIEKFYEGKDVNVEKNMGGYGLRVTDLSGGKAPDDGSSAPAAQVHL